jgi:hypothetical protein
MGVGRFLFVLPLISPSSHRSRELLRRRAPPLHQRCSFLSLLTDEPSDAAYSLSAGATAPWSVDPIRILPLIFLWFSMFFVFIVASR